MKEIWKDIKGYEGIYQVSNLGKVKRITFINGTCKMPCERFMTPTDNGNGYLIVGLSKNGKRKNFYLHRLVAETFIPNPENKPEVNHKKGNRYDNRAKKLEWVTSSENQNHAKEVLKVKYNLEGLNISREKQKRKVAMLDKNGNVIKVFDSIADAGRYINAGFSGICGCCRGVYKTIKGYKWKYVEDIRKN